MKSLPLLFVSVRLHQARLFCARQNRSFLTQRVALVATILCLASSAAPALAQTTSAAINPAASTAPASAATGEITGRVQNVAIGRYLDNARVQVKETNQTVYTDRNGVYTLVDVPSGPVTLEVFYTGLDVMQTPVTVITGGTINQDIDLTSVARYGRHDGIVLNKFVVAADRETNSEAISVNEQRHAANIVNVTSTDTIGAVIGNSAGEFLKFIPGLTVEYDTIDASTISLRGIGPDKTGITVDNVPQFNPWINTSRQVDLHNMALTNISRVEVHKVPTPAMPADSLAGSINMIGKSAFERKGREFHYALNFLGSSEDFRLGSSPTSWRDEYTKTVIPGGDFDFSWPVSKTFGVVLNGSHATYQNQQHIAQMTWSNSATNTIGNTASLQNPVLASFLLGAGNRKTVRSSLSAKADWKLGKHGQLSLSGSKNQFDLHGGIPMTTFSAGTNGTPTLVGGVPLTWDPTFTRGATGRGTITKTVNNQLLNQKTDTTVLRYLYDDGHWKVETGLSRTSGTLLRRYQDVGFFNSVTATSSVPLRINLLGFNQDQPTTIEVFDNNNQPLEWHSLANFVGSNATDLYTFRGSRLDNAYFNLRRRFTIFPFPTSLQVGGQQRVQSLDSRPTNVTWNFTGPDGNSGATASIAPYAYQNWINQDNHYGFSNILWMSPSRSFEQWQKNPLLFTQTPAQVVSAESFRIDNSEFIKETVQSLYMQGEATFLGERVRVLGGVRYEKTRDNGLGALTNADAVWQRGSAGAYIRDAAGNRIRKPEAGAVNSIQELLLTKKERSGVSNRTYDGYYPSLHITYSPVQAFLVRAAYARTYGRPDFSDVIPRTVEVPVDPADQSANPSLANGTLRIRNSSLKPWTADNYDLSLEYYTPQGGVFSAGLFRKDIKNFFGAGVQNATPELLSQLGLDQRFVGWDIITKFNAGEAQITGGEFNIRQSLLGLGSWGKHFSLFANATKLRLGGNRGADFSSFIPLSGSWGGSFNKDRVTVSLRWNYRGLDKRTPASTFGPDGYSYLKAKTILDINAVYRMTPRLSLTAGASNVHNTPQTILTYGSSTPDYARQTRVFDFGVQLSVGISGTF